MAEQRVVRCESGEITYCLEQKPVKNLNLRIHQDGSVFVSANSEVSPERVDQFMESKAGYIQKVQKRFREQEQFRAPEKHYVSGETFYVLGRGLRLHVKADTKNEVTSDGVYLFLRVKEPENEALRKRLVLRYLDRQCREVFGEIIQEVYPTFEKYGVEMPTLRIRDMETRWGTCLSKKGIVTLNKRLLEAPRNCIEYVVTHEFCHFIHPNHSRHFYAFLTMLMPDWKQRKQVLDQSAVYWL